ncbi:hypothetical protein E2C01_016000 [Portunus trituberculatus]|uniref:Uncharacterized protein n=1 Tax=Portunus trituberculatus TaxID=210409 RepID=A0A5B7DNE7_PORTR|nr:hypothetical protein [Portunus trituberculatus]
MEDKEQQDQHIISAYNVVETSPALKKLLGEEVGKGETKNPFDDEEEMQEQTKGGEEMVEEEEQVQQETREERRRRRKDRRQRKKGKKGGGGGNRRGGRRKSKGQGASDGGENESEMQVPSTTEDLMEGQESAIITTQSPVNERIMRRKERKRRRKEKRQRKENQRRRGGRGGRRKAEEVEGEDRSANEVSRGQRGEVISDPTSRDPQPDVRGSAAERRRRRRRRKRRKKDRKNRNGRGGKKDRRRNRGRKGGNGNGNGNGRREVNEVPEHDISLISTNEVPIPAESAANTLDDVPNEFHSVLPKRPKKQTGNRKRKPQQTSREDTLDETSLESEIQEVLTTPTTTTTTTTTSTTTTTTTTTEAPMRHPKAPALTPVEPQYTVDGDTETTRTIFDFYPEDTGEEVPADTQMEEEPRAASDSGIERPSSDSGRKKDKKKKKKKTETSTLPEDSIAEYPDEDMELQDYQNYLYGLENTEESSSEATALEDLFPEGLPEGYPTDRLRSDGNFSQNTR